MVSRGSKQRRWNKDYQQLTVQWRRRGGCGVRRRSRCADWSAGFGPSIARPRRPAVSGYAGRLSYPEGGWHQRCYGRYSRVEMGASLGERTCDVEITATGPLSELKIPKVPGLETFRGKVFHSARWDADYDLRDRRVAVVGIGLRPSSSFPGSSRRSAPSPCLSALRRGSCRAAGGASVMWSSVDHG